MHRFFINEQQIGEKYEISDRGQVHQILDVLKLCVGEQIVLVLNKGEEAVCKIVATNKKHISLAVLKKRQNVTEPARYVALYCSVLKRDNFEWVVQKATECGVARIVPVITDRTVKLGLNKERLQKISQEAAEQSGRGALPVIESVLSLQESLQQVGQFDATVFFHASDTSFFAQDVKSHERVAIFVGPEGGWSDAEIVAATAAGCHVRSLGPRVLRAETAAIVATFNAVNF